MFAVVMCYNLHLSNCMWIKGGGVGGCDMVVGELYCDQLELWIWIRGRGSYV